MTHSCKMKRWLVVLLIANDVFVCAKRPNILLIYADDLGWNDVDWHDESLRTPNLRQMAFDRHTVQLDQAYVNQLCSPTRSALMTGHYPHHIGTQTGVFWVMEPSGVPLSTYLVGKWHLGYCKYEFLPTRRGFDKFRGYYGDKEGYFNHSRELWTKKHGFRTSGLDFFSETWNTSSVPDWSKEGFYSSEVFADETIELLESHEKNKPFFLYLAFQSVHAPLEVPDKYVRRCASISRNDRRLYCGMLSALDEAIGRVIERLIKLGQYENTIIIFSSDNGGQTMFGGNNYPLRGNKDTLWEGGTRTNCFVHSPRFIKEHSVRQQLFHVVDWFPTILAMAGQDIQAYGTCYLLGRVTFLFCDISGDGINQWPMILNGTEGFSRKSFIYNIDAKGAAIREGRYKLIVGDPGSPSGWIPPSMDSRGGPPITQSTWLFDLKNDPNERRDLSRLKVRVVRKLTKKLFELARTTVPSVHRKIDDRGNPIYWGGTYATGWC